MHIFYYLILTFLPATMSQEVPSYYQKLHQALQYQPPTVVQEQAQMEKILDDKIANATTETIVCAEILYEIKGYPFDHPHLKYLDVKYRHLGYPDVRYIPTGYFTGLKTPCLCVVLNTNWGIDDVRKNLSNRGRL